MNSHRTEVSTLGHALHKGTGKAAKLMEESDLRRKTNRYVTRDRTAIKWVGELLLRREKRYETQRKENGLILHCLVFSRTDLVLLFLFCDFNNGTVTMLMKTQYQLHIGRVLPHYVLLTSVPSEIKHFNKTSLVQVKSKSKLPYNLITLV
jgi:hypothetical protein